MANDPPTSVDETSHSPSVTERALAALWNEVLQTAEQPVATDNFFAIGGDSMAMVILELRIKEEFSVELPAGTVLNAPTLRELSAMIDAACGGWLSAGAQSAEPHST